MAWRNSADLNVLTLEQGLLVVVVIRFETSGNKVLIHWFFHETLLKHLMLILCL